MTKDDLIALRGVFERAVRAEEVAAAINYSGLSSAEAVDIDLQRRRLINDAAAARTNYWNALDQYIAEGGT